MNDAVPSTAGRRPMSIGRPIPGIEARAEFAKLTADAARGRDYSGKAKVILFAGRGRTGKTTIVRYFADRLSSIGGRVAVMDADRTNPVLRDYLEGVDYPPLYEEDAVAGWIARQSLDCAGSGLTVLVDLGGSDGSLLRLAEQSARFPAEVEKRGGALILCCTLGPSPDDLAPFVNIHAAGLQPSAACFLFNEGALPSGNKLHPKSFETVLANPSYQDLRKRWRGVPVLVPKLYVADEVEKWRLPFSDIRDGQSPSPDVIISPWEQIVVQSWMDDMEAAFSPISSWFG